MLPTGNHLESREVWVESPLASGDLPHPLVHPAPSSPLAPPSSTWSEKVAQQPLNHEPICSASCSQSEHPSGSLQSLSEEGCSGFGWVLRGSDVHHGLISCVQGGGVWGRSLDLCSLGKCSDMTDGNPCSSPTSIQANNQNCWLCREEP